MELGYGAGAIGDYPWHLDGTRPWKTIPDVENTLKCFSLFGELGIKWIDTAWRYGNGESERLVGSGLRTKGRKWTEMAVITKIPVGEASEMDGRLRESVGRLGRVPDALLLHDPDLGRWEELERACQWLVRKKVAWYGISSEPCDQVRKAVDFFGLTAVEFPASSWDWRAERIMANWMAPRAGFLRIANRILGGPKREKGPMDVRKAMEYLVENRAWIDVALIGTTNQYHLKECAAEFKKAKEAVEK